MKYQKIYRIGEEFRKTAILKSDKRVDVVVSLVPNVTSIDEVKNNLKGLETRRRRWKKARKPKSTSSEDDGISKGRSSPEDQESLEISSEDSSSSSSVDRRKPKSSAERRGWRKWHRKCQACPEDMAKKWRDPSINWICGGYQRARRTFKSLCMMHYRNCQDGTMFVKIHDHRCANDTPNTRSHGIHFFYDYRVALSGDSTEVSSDSSPTDDDSSDDW